MSSSDSTKRSLRAPPPRTPLTPRTAGNNGASTRLSAPRLPGNTPRPATLSPRLKSFDGAPPGDVAQAVVTPHSTMKRPKTGNASSPEGISGGPGPTLSSRPRVPRPKTAVSDVASRSHPLARSPGLSDPAHQISKDSIDSRFFHASDVQRQEPAPKRPEPKKVPTFFYADGKQDETAVSPRPPSPVLSTLSEQRTSAPWLKLDARNDTSKSPPVLSPSLMTTSSPFFASAALPNGHLRSPSPSKENIHLSYRKGASQIFGMRPNPPSATSSPKPTPIGPDLELRQQTVGPRHQKSPSMSSIDSGNSHGSRRRSATSVEPAAGASPLTNEVKATNSPQDRALAVDLPLTINTFLKPSDDVASPPQLTLSPTKHAFDIAADARRERKVLDLEISNSSLLAINASLEREVRRQKAELKRFRRLSRAGRFSIGPKDSTRRISNELDEVDGEDESEDNDDFGFASAIAEELDESSEEEEESLTSSGLLPLGTQSDKHRDRLAKDEKRLRVDLERHKELLVQSQAMNQSLKRCMFATEEMIRDGRKALKYSVRVSDVKLGGRILTGHEDEDEDIIEVEDDFTEGEEGMENAKGLLDVWRGVGRPAFEGSEGSGDRDSGIEVDKPVGEQGLPPRTSLPPEDSGRPPEEYPLARYADQPLANLPRSSAS